MRFRERSNEEQHEQARHDPQTPDPGGGSFSQLRQAGDAFLQAGDDAINRALSGDSEAFLAANRQQGGE